MHKFPASLASIPKRHIAERSLLRMLIRFFSLEHTANSTARRTYAVTKGKPGRNATTRVDEPK